MMTQSTRRLDTNAVPNLDDFNQEIAYLLEMIGCQEIARRKRQVVITKAVCWHGRIAVFVQDVQILTVVQKTFARIPAEKLRPLRPEELVKGKLAIYRKSNTMYRARIEKVYDDKFASITYIDVGVFEIKVPIENLLDTRVVDTTVMYAPAAEVRFPREFFANDFQWHVQTLKRATVKDLLKRSIWFEELVIDQQPAKDQIIQIPVVQLTAEDGRCFEEIVKPLLYGARGTWRERYCMLINNRFAESEPVVVKCMRELSLAVQLKRYPLDELARLESELEALDLELLEKFEVDTIVAVLWNNQLVRGFITNVGVEHVEIQVADYGCSTRQSMKNIWKLPEHIADRLPSYGVQVKLRHKPDKSIYEGNVILTNIVINEARNTVTADIEPAIKNLKKTIAEKKTELTQMTEQAPPSSEKVVEERTFDTEARTSGDDPDKAGPIPHGECYDRGSNEKNRESETSGSGCLSAPHHLRNDAGNTEKLDVNEINDSREFPEAVLTNVVNTSEVESAKDTDELPLQDSETLSNVPTDAEHEVLDDSTQFADADEIVSSVTIEAVGAINIGEEQFSVIGTPRDDDGGTNRDGTSNRLKEDDGSTRVKEKEKKLRISKTALAVESEILDDEMSSFEVASVAELLVPVDEILLNQQRQENVAVVEVESDAREGSNSESLQEVSDAIGIVPICDQYPYYGENNDDLKSAEVTSDGNTNGKDITSTSAIDLTESFGGLKIDVSPTQQAPSTSSVITKAKQQTLDAESPASHLATPETDLADSCIDFQKEASNGTSYQNSISVEYGALTSDALTTTYEELYIGAGNKHESEKYTAEDQHVDMTGEYQNCVYTVGVSHKGKIAVAEGAESSGVLALEQRNSDATTEESCTITAILSGIYAEDTAIDGGSFDENIGSGRAVDALNSESDLNENYGQLFKNQQHMEEVQANLTDQMSCNDALAAGDMEIASYKIRIDDVFDPSCFRAVLVDQEAQLIQQLAGIDQPQPIALNCLRLDTCVLARMHDAFVRGVVVSITRSGVTLELHDCVGQLFTKEVYVCPLDIETVEPCLFKVVLREPASFQLKNGLEATLICDSSLDGVLYGFLN